MIDPDLLLRFGGALAAVVALIVGLAWLARLRLGRSLPGAGRRRLAVVEGASIDSRTREHLLAVGPAGGAASAALPRPADAANTESR
jgi:flagellar biogenesis protein FliO